MMAMTNRQGRNGNDDETVGSIWKTHGDWQDDDGKVVIEDRGALVTMMMR
jgi:hypothetical protein